jgi:glutamine amidotransferase
MASVRKVQIIDLSIGNIKSVQNMFEKIGCSVDVISKPKENSGESVLILAGVGAFDSGVSRLRDTGWFDEIKRAAKLEQHILGICLGMQLLCESSTEGSLEGLGLIPGSFISLRMSANRVALKVPHMGWNNVSIDGQSRYLGSFVEREDLRFYFVHSFEYQYESEEYVVGYTNYGSQVAAIIEKDNLVGVQFHPEKSHRFGMELLATYMESVSVAK